MMRVCSSSHTGLFFAGGRREGLIRGVDSYRGSWGPCLNWDGGPGVGDRDYMHDVKNTGVKLMYSSLQD